MKIDDGFLRQALKVMCLVGKQYIQALMVVSGEDECMTYERMEGFGGGEKWCIGVYVRFVFHAGGLLACFYAAHHTHKTVALL
jgi:hypothetical protein